MANETPETGNQWTEDSSFLGKKVDTVYNDFFQETSDGKISVGSKAQKSGLEVFTNILWYVLPVAIIVVLLGSAHVFLRTQESGGMVEKYPFLCSYMNKGVNLEASERGCNSLKKIGEIYAEKHQQIQGDITKKLNEYIPIKIVKNLMATSAEKTFVTDAYAKKIRVDKIMNQFKQVLQDSQYKAMNNIECTGVSIDLDGVLTTQCTIYGKDVGADDTNGRLGSSRIEAMDFVDELSNAPKNHFVLLNSPTSLSSEKIASTEWSGFFTTRTTLPIQVRYVPFSE